MNRLCELPRGFGSFPALEILDLTYNNLTSSSFSANFAYLGECLRALYMGDNDLTVFPPNIGKFTKLEIVSWGEGAREGGSLYANACNSIDLLDHPFNEITSQFFIFITDA